MALSSRASVIACSACDGESLGSERVRMRLLGMSDVESSRGGSTPQPPGLSLPGGSSPTPKAAPSHRSPAPGPGSPTGKRKVSIASSVASGASLASLLTKLHQPPATSLSLEGKLKVRATLDCGSDVLSCKFSPDGATIGVALRSGQVRFFSQAGALSHTLQFRSRLPVQRKLYPRTTQISTKITVKGKIISPSPASECHVSRQLAESDGEAAAPATSLIWMPGGQPDAVLATYADGQVVSWCGRSVGVVCKDGGVDVRAALVGGLDNQVVTFTRSQVNIRDVNSLCSVTTMDQEMGGHLIGRGALWAVTGRGREIVGGGSGLTWWDARTSASTRSVGGVQVRGPALAWHPNANKMVSGSWGGGGDSVKVWEASSAKTTHVLYSDAANTSVYTTTWVGKEVVLVGGGDPNLLRLATLDNTTVGVMRGIRAPVWAVDAYMGRGHQGTRIGVASGTTLYILDVLK
ncbi:uncharacterized protein LOC134764943 [Penaeus indicus]|uniref:uncharacterized protein LOC134764943 n=1 Tax=Penaeus indicus TaxID=29960 RepID=UPI00300D9691